MTKRAELLEQIRTATDEHPYQVYADYLEQEGDQPRAMLIRFQCELAGLAWWRSRRREVERDVDALVAEHGARWRGELPALDGIEWTDFERGFVSAVRVRDVAALYTHALAIATAAPVTCVELMSLDERGEAPPESIPWLRRVRLRGLRDPHFDDSRSLLALPPELDLSELDEYVDVGPLIAAVRRGRTTPLERLIVSGDHVAGATIARGLGDLDTSQLRELAIGTEFVDEDTGYFGDATLRLDDARELAARRLERLEVLDLARQPVSSLGLEAVVDSLPRLREIDARASGATELDFLVRSEGAPIVALDLGENAIADAGAAAIAGAQRLATLESLDLDRCEITADGLAALTASRLWPRLHRLDLGENPLGLAGALALAEAPTPKRLATLYLADIDATREATAILADLPWLWQLQQVDLSRNAVAPALVRALANVRALAIRQAELDADAAAALAPIFPQLRHLAIANNRFGDAGLAAFAADGAIETLDLRACGLGDASLVRVASLHWPRLRALALSRNAFTRHGVAALVRSPLVARLTRLDLAHCELDDRVVPVLAETPALAGLTSLNLTGARLTELSLLVLARSPYLRGVKRIGLPTGVSLSRTAYAELDERFGRGWQYYYDPDDDELSAARR